MEWVSNISISGACLILGNENEAASSLHCYRVRGERGGSLSGNI